MSNENPLKTYSSIESKIRSENNRKNGPPYWQPRGTRVSRENSRDSWTSFGPTPTRARAHARSCVQRMSAYGNDRPGNAGQAPACCLRPRLPAISSKYRGDYLEKQPRPLQTESISF